MLLTIDSSSRPMRLRSANVQLRSPTIDLSDYSPSDRTLRSSGRRSPESTPPEMLRTPSKRCFGDISTGYETPPAYEAGWSAGRQSKRRSSHYPQSLQLLTPAPSPGNVPGCIDDNDKATVYFLDMPIEVHQLICEYLPEDKDVASYALVCVKTSEYISSSVWHKRFVSAFDPIEDPSAEEAHLEYKERRAFEKVHVDFTNGAHPLHARFLNMLKDMIIQSDMRVVIDSEGKSHYEGRNHKWMRQVMADIPTRRTGRRGTNLVNAICNIGSLVPWSARKCGRTTSPFVTSIQLCLLHLALDLNVCIARAPKIINSQHQVYKCRLEEPIFKGKHDAEINFPWLLHVANFFKFHLKTHAGEGLLAHIYESFDETERPRPWCGKIKEGTQELGKHWRGTFTYLPEDMLDYIRKKEGEAVMDEAHQDNYGFQDLTLFFDIKGHPELQFTDHMEEELEGMPDVLLRDTYQTPIEHKDFFGLGYNGSQFHLNGRIHAMPVQAEIPGFQRVSMMVCLPDEDGRYGYGHSSCWGYEGCVLPGNQIMLGRWWRAYEPEGEPSYSGPFIFWAIDGSAEDRLKDATTAVRFLETVEDKTV